MPSWCLVWLSVYVSAPLVAQVPAPMVEDQSLQGLAEIARASGVSLVAAVPRDHPLPTVPAALPPHALVPLLWRSGCEAAVFRRLLVVRAPAPSVPLRQLLGSALPADLAPFLLDLRPFKDRWDLVRSAAVVMATHQAGPEASDVCLKMALALAARELAEIERQIEATANGSALVRIVSPSPDPNGVECGCREHLLIACPKLGPHDELEPLWLAFHGPDHDLFRSALEKQRGTIPLDEFIARAVARSRSQESLWPVQAEGEADISLPAARRTLAALGAELAAASGATIGVSPDLANMELYCACDEVPLCDVLAGMAAAAKGVLLQTEDGYRIDTPQSLRERLACALPLDLWATVSVGGSERDLALRDATREAWRACDAHLPALRTAASRIGDWSDELRYELRRLVTIQAARDLRRWLHNLPSRDGGIPLWLLEHKDGPYYEYELRAPTASCFVAGLEYLLIRCTVEGRPVTEFPVPAEGGRP